VWLAGRQRVTVGVASQQQMLSGTGAGGYAW